MPGFKHIATIAIVVLVVVWLLAKSPFKKSFGLAQ
jgi:hypothetical protein